MEEINLLGRPPRDAASWVWDQLIGGSSQKNLQAALSRAILTRRWFGAKTRTIRAVEIVNAIPLGPGVRLILIQIEFTAGPAEVYQIPLALAEGAKAETLLADNNSSLWIRVRMEDGQRAAMLVDGLYDGAVCQDLLKLIETKSTRPMMMSGELAAWQAGPFGELRGDVQIPLPARLVRAEQSNSSVIFGDRLILKLFRRIETGLNPDLEINAYLTERDFAHVPPLAGAVEYRRSGEAPWGLAMLQGFVANRGDAWQYTLDGLNGFFDCLREQPLGAADVPHLPADGIVPCSERDLPAMVSQAFGAFLSDAQRLGTCTAEMHLALATETDKPAFCPEPLTRAEQDAFQEGCGQLADDVFTLLHAQLPSLSDGMKARAVQVLGMKGAVEERLQRLATKEIHAWQIRCHGDYHLGQVLVTDGDFMIIDFEGEPSRPLNERRKKQLALRDVAGMIRSYHYASCSAASQAKQNRSQADARLIEQWAGAWYFWISVAFLAAYRRTASGGAFLPASREEFECLLETCLLEKALYELRYELNNRPDWVYLPLQAIVDLVSGDAMPR